jgi:hypothetical protein
MKRGNTFFFKKIERQKMRKADDSPTVCMVIAATRQALIHRIPYTVVGFMSDGSLVVWSDDGVTIK